jgi:hypothetical protein
VSALWALVAATEPTTTPKASIPMIATAAERGEGMELRSPAEAAAGMAAPSASTSPRASMASIRSAMAWGRPPRRVPHSTQ